MMTPSPLVYNSSSDIARYDFMVSGHTYILDLRDLKVIDLTSGTVTVLQNANALLKGNVRSMMIFTSDADTIFQNYGVQIGFNDHSNLHIFNNINTSRDAQQITIIPPSGKVPASIDLNFTISDAPYIEDVYIKDLQLVHTKKTNSLTAISATGWTDILLVHLGYYDQLTFQLTETGGVNPMNWQTLVSEDASTWTVLADLPYPQIAASDYVTFSTSIKWHFYRVQVQCGTAAATCNATINASPIR